MKYKYKTENEVIKHIALNVDNTYNLRVCYNAEFREHCENIGSEIPFIFKWEKKEFRIEMVFKFENLELEFLDYEIEEIQ